MTFDRFSRWFELTREEQLWMAGILAIFLVGLVARWYHVTREPAMEPPRPALTETPERVIPNP